MTEAVIVQTWHMAVAIGGFLATAGAVHLAFIRPLQADNKARDLEIQQAKDYRASNDQRWSDHTAQHGDDMKAVDRRLEKIEENVGEILSKIGELKGRIK